MSGGLDGADTGPLVPVEPHALLPFAHWLPPRLRRPYWRLGAAGGWEEIPLLRRAELEALFGPARPSARPAGEELGTCVAPYLPGQVRRLMSLQTPFTTRNSISTSPTEL